MLDDRPPPPVSVLFALSPIARATLALAVVAGVVSVVLLVGSPGSTPVTFHAKLTSICSHVGSRFESVTTVGNHVRLAPRGLLAIEHDAGVYGVLTRQLLALTVPSVEAPYFRVFVAELTQGDATWTKLANAARAGHTAQLAAIESVINAPFAYANSEGLGCSSA
jgi:hypothetical protein